MKRFYKEASARETPGGFAVALDSRPVRTPAGARLVVAARPLAEALAEEWRSQGAELRRETMPLTRLTCAAIDHVPARRGDIVDEIAAFAATDLVCYRVAEPDTLMRRQSEAWQPLVAWAERRYDVALRITAGLVPVAQDPETVARLRQPLDALDDVRLTAFSHATRALGSLVIALALLEEQVDAVGAWSASVVDETYQIERWGADAELEARLARLRVEIEDAQRLLTLARA